MIQEKNCKAKTKAKDYQNACGTLTNVSSLKYGLCPSCYWDWMHTSENGKIHKEKQFIPKTKKISDRNRKQILKESKINLLTPDKYRSKYLQPTINKIARLIDFGQSCIATDNFGKMNGGHYRSVGSNRTIALNLHNIHIQSFESNVFRGGDDKNYKDGLIDRYGLRYFEFVDRLRQHKPINLSLEDMKTIQSKALVIVKDLENNQRQSNPEQRIMLRNIVNLELNVYDNEFSVYKLLK